MTPGPTSFPIVVRIRNTESFAPLYGFVPLESFLHIRIAVILTPFICVVEARLCPLD